MTDSTPEITVSIVSMNNADELRRCVRSIYAHHADLKLEVIVVLYRTPVDHAATLRDEFPQVRFVISGDEWTRGYAENQNLGLRLARGRYSVILNDDIEFKDDALKQLRDYHRDHPDLAALFPKLLNPDGSVQVADRGEFTPFSFVAHLFHLTPLLARIPPLRRFLFDAPGFDHDGPVPAKLGSGAFFWVSTDMLRRVGYMDERYFLAPDDMDLSKRIVQSGGHMSYVPTVTAVHAGGRTLSKVFSKVVPVSLFGSSELFRVHNGRLAGVLVDGSIGVFSLVSAGYWAASWLGGNRVRAATMLRARANVARFMVGRRKSTKDMFLESW